MSLARSTRSLARSLPRQLVAPTGARYFTVPSTVRKAAEEGSNASIDPSIKEDWPKNSQRSDPSDVGHSTTDGSTPVGYVPALFYRLSVAGEFQMSFQ